MPKGSEDRRVGRALPSPVNPVSTICFRITIPDAVPYRAALVGVLAELTQWYAWDHARGVNDCPDCEEAAQLWSAALAGSSYSLDCEDTLDCIDIIPCIETDVDVRKAITDAVLSSPDMTEYITNIINNTGGIVPNQNNQNLLKPDACDKDAIFAQASTVVQLLHDITEDIFEAVEVGTNALERAELLINILGGGTRALIADTILQWADIMAETVQEEYAGAYDTALYDELRCELFCRVDDSCVMTIKDVHNFYSDKFSGALPNNIWDSLKAIADFQILGDFPGDTVIYSMHLLIINLIMAGDNVLGIDFSRLGLRVIAAAATPDPTWETLCEDCAEVPNIRLEVYPGYPEDMLEFISNVGENSWWRVHRRGTGHYVTGAYRSVGLIPFYILESRDAYGLYWNDNGNQVSSGTYGMDEMPCYLPTTFLITIGGPSYPGEDDTIEILVSRESCPVWEIQFTWGTIVSETPTQVVLSSVLIGSTHQLYAQMLTGVKMHVDSITYDPGVGGISYFNAAGTNVPGFVPVGADITGITANNTVPFTITINGAIGPI